MNNILYLKIQKPEKDDLAGPPFASFRLKSRSEDEQGIYIGSYCFSLADVKTVVDNIKKDLDEIIKLARREY